MGFISGLKKAIGIADKVTSAPIVGSVLGAIPAVNTAVTIIHATSQLIPEDQGEKRRREAIAAMKALHPELNEAQIGNLIDAIGAIQAAK